MTLNDLTQGELWMDLQERQTAAELVQSFQQLFAERQIPETLFLVLRVRDFVLHHTLCLRLERSLTPSHSPEDGNPRHSREDGNPSSPATVAPVLAGHIGRTRDRLRKSLKDLEDAADKLDPTAPVCKAPGKGKHAAKKGLSVAVDVSGEATPYNPMNDPKFWQKTIEAVGIDLNDPDFFADEDNYYDLPPSRHPETQAEPKPDPSVTPAQVSVTPAQAGAQPPSVTPAQAGAQSSDTSPNPSPAQNPTPSDPEPSASASPRPPLSIVNYPLSIPPTPPPKVFIYKVKPTPFNQGRRQK